MNKVVMNARLVAARKLLSQVGELLDDIAAEMVNADPDTPPVPTTGLPKVQPGVEIKRPEPEPEPEPFVWLYCGHGFELDDMLVNDSIEAVRATYLSDNQSIHQTDDDRMKEIWEKAPGGFSTLLNIEEAAIPELKAEWRAYLDQEPCSTDWWDYHTNAMKRWCDVNAAAGPVACYRLAEFGVYFPIGGTNPVLEGEKVVDPAMKYQDIHKKLTERTINFMAKSKQQEKPFFIYLAHYLVHGPWDPNREFATDEEWEIYQKQPVRGHLQNGGDKIYPALVRELDWHVGEVLKALKEQGQDENTFVVFMADNGPWLPAGSAWPLRGCKFNTFEGGHRVPSIAWWPGQITPGQVSENLCSTMDIFPTIARLAGAELPKDRVIDGADIWDVMAGKAKLSPHDVLYYYCSVIFISAGSRDVPIYPSGGRTTDGGEAWRRSMWCG